MSTPSYAQVVIPPGKQQIAWGNELVAAGTPATTFTLEPCKPTLTLQSQMYEPDEFFGSGITVTDWIEMSHHGELSLEYDVRVDGIGGDSMIRVCGDVANAGSSDTIVGTGPYTHTVVAGSNAHRMNTYSFAYGLGSGDVLHLTYGTIDETKLTWASNNPLKATTKFICFFPSADTVMPTVGAMTDLTRETSYAGTFNLYSSGGGLYTAKMLSGGLTIQRSAKPEFTTSSGTQQPLDIIPDMIKMALDASDFFFTGVGGAGATTSIYYDYLNKLKFGTAANPNSLSWAIGGKSLTVKSFPWKWDPGLKLQPQNGSLHLSGSAHIYNDYATALTGKYSAPSSIVVINDTATLQLA